MKDCTQQRYGIKDHQSDRTVKNGLNSVNYVLLQRVGGITT